MTLVLALNRKRRVRLSICWRCSWQVRAAVVYQIVPCRSTEKKSGIDQIDFIFVRLRCWVPTYEPTYLLSKYLA